ncbi:autophagy-related protein 13b-like [Gossypium arboreum]|uniref:autophagy-related protein 13b-like n=1 Tax=Gossypium arboreum TaxID=29729 RepID=UPI0022F1B9F1|nr:autophagy-related protein 13b-like [Gossypium arboreum]
MTSTHTNSHTEAAKMEQVITEFFYKSLLIILESRSSYVSSRNYSGEQIVSSPSSSSSSSSSVRPRDKWFNLALRECPSALENLDLCRQSNFEPVVVDVILEQKPLDWGPASFSPTSDIVRNLSSKNKNSYFWNSDQDESGSEMKCEKIIERWFVHHESRKGRDCNSGNRRSSCNNLSALYKKLILMLRSLYVTVRLLPAYNIFRDLNSSGLIRSFKLVPRVSSFVEPLTRKEEVDMQRFWFTPVDTSCGRLCLSVLYYSSISDMSSESSTPMSPQFIPDYVGSPLADPLRRFPSLPVSHGSPSSLPFSRRHSWSYDHYKASPPLVSFSPSPTHSESNALVSNPSSRGLPPMSLPPHPPEAPLAHKRDTNFDEYCPSPSFSASPSPSPSPSVPIYIPRTHLSKALLRSESAPVNIAAPKLANSPALSGRQNLPPSPPLKITRAGTSRTDNIRVPAETDATIEKIFSFGKEDCWKYSGVKAFSNSSPRISCSRSSSRSLQDDFDYSEFPCPFDVEDGEMMDPGSRPESYVRRGNPSDPNEAELFMNRKSPDAAVGALVRMLEKAPPLRQNVSLNFSEASRPEILSNSIPKQSQISEAVTVEHAAAPIIASFRLVSSKTTTDALEELRGYKVMKNLLLSEGGKAYTSSNVASAAEHSSTSQGPMCLLTALL